MTRPGGNACGSMTTSARKSDVSTTHPLQVQYERLPPLLWDEYATRRDERYARIHWPATLADCAARYPNLEACAAIIAAGDLSEASLNKMMVQGIAEEGFPATVLRALFYTHSPY